MLHNIKLYIAFAKVQFLTQLEYRGAYFVRTLSKVLSFGAGFAMIAILLTRFQIMGSWSVYEVLFMYALNMLAYSISSTFMIMPFRGLSDQILNGSIDSILTKPLNPMFYLICQNVSAGYTSNYVIGAGIIAISIAQLGIQLTLVKILFLFLTIISGSLIYAALYVIVGTPAFWLTKNNALITAFYSISSFADYPISIYAVSIQALLTFVIPVAFINFYPAQLFLSNTGTMFSPVFLYLAPLVAALMCVIAYGFWNIGLNAYKSSGS